MHIADFTVGHLGANAIVGGGVPIATGAAMASRYFADDGVVCCFAGDGAYANGVVLEVAEFRRPGPVHQPLRQRARLRPADHLPGLQQPLRHDRPRRRRSVGREPPGAARRRVRRQQHARRGRQRHERPGRARRGAARREALPRRQGAGADRGRLLSLLGPFVERSAQRISHQGRGSGLEGGRPDRDLQEGIDRRRRARRRGNRSGDAPRRRAQRARRQARRRRRRSRRQGRPHFHVHGHEERDRSAAVRQGRDSTRRLPEIEARQRRDHLQGRAARGARRGNDARQPRRVLRRGRRRLRRRVQGDEGPARNLRPPARVQHADQRSLHLRHRLSARRCGA